MGACRLFRDDDPADRVEVVVKNPPKRCSERVIDTVWEDIRVRVVPPDDYPITEGFEGRIRAGVSRWLAGESVLVIPVGFTLELHHVTAG